ncbi:MAG: rod shape-determining protein MreC [Pseudomonadota bacterium]
MSVVGHQPPPFFKRGPAPLARLAFFIALSLLMLVLDLRFHTLELVRQSVALVMHPMQRLAYAPVVAFDRLDNFLSSLATLEQENDGLRQNKLANARLLLRQDHLELENQRLRALLDMKLRQPVTSQVAEILYAARDPFARRVILDKGAQKNIVAGQVVVDEIGVVGQITRVFPMLSEVTLITDKDQAIPVQIVRNGLRSVLFGAGAGNLELRFLAANADVQAGDQLVTSGLDEVYLPGLPVAKVTRVDRDTSYAFARILCEPSAGVERHGQVLVLGSREVQPLAPPTPELKDKPDKGRKGKKRD